MHSTKQTARTAGVLAMVDAIAEAGVTLPGVNGDAAAAASFAGQWSERCKSAATPFQGMRLYELLELGEIPRTEGQLRQADPSDRNLMIQWTHAFRNEIGESANDTELRVDRGLAEMVPIAPIARQRYDLRGHREPSKDIHPTKGQSLNCPSRCF